MPSQEALRAIDAAKARMDAASDALRALVVSDERPDDYRDRHRAAVNELNAATNDYLAVIGRAMVEG